MAPALLMLPLAASNTCSGTPDASSTGPSRMLSGSAAPLKRLRVFPGLLVLAVMKHSLLAFQRDVVGGHVPQLAPRPRQTDRAI